MKRLAKTTLLTAAMLAALLPAGCGRQSTNNGSEPAATATTSPAPGAAAESEPTEQIVKVYYADSDITRLVEAEATISYTTQEEKLLEALKTLKVNPTTETFSLCPNMNFQSAQLVDGVWNISLTFPDTDRLGAGGEGFLVEAIQNTLFQFEEVQAFRILIDGQKQDSLMGHMELQDPFKR